MAGVVEFLIKMQDGLTSPLAKITQTSGSAKSALGKLTDSNKQLKSMVGESGKSVNELNARIAKLKEYRDILPPSAETKIRAINSEINQLNKSLNNLQTMNGSKVKVWFKEAFDGIPAIVKNPVALAAAGVGLAFNEGMKQSREKLDFKLLLGETGGNEMYGELQKLKPFLGDSVKTVAKDLLDVGIASDKVRPLMAQLGAAARGDEGKFSSLAGAFKEMQKEGKLTEGALAAMNDAGFKPLTHISEKYGVKMSVLQQKLADGKINIDMVNEALSDATGKGGEFEGVLSKLGKEPSVMLSVLSGRVGELAGSFGTALMPAATVVFDVLNTGFDYLGVAVDYTASLFEKLFVWGKENEDMLWALAAAVGGGVLAYKAYQGVQVLSYMWMMRDTIATSALATAKGVLATVTGGLTVATGALNAVFLASPIGWIVGGIGLLVGGIVLAWNKVEGFRKVVYGMWESVKSIFSNIGKFFGKLFGYDMGDYESVGAAWGKGMAKGADSFKKSQEEKKSKSATEAHFGSPLANALMPSKFTDGKSEKGGSSAAQAGLNAVSGGGVKNITITVGKMVEHLEVKIIGGTQQMAQEVQRAAEEALVRALASASGR
jgi:hypothetical protein